MGFFFKGKEVAVIGGGDAAITSALYLAEICPKVLVLARGEKLRAEQYWLDKLSAKKNIEVHLNTPIVEFKGTNSLETIVTNGEIKEFNVAGAFIEVGHEPNKAFTDAIGVKTDEHGFIVVDNEQQTSIPGLYAAGDATNASNKFAQLLTCSSRSSSGLQKRLVAKRTK